jgi:4-hydroxybenzoyl-CoA thioesterase
VPSAFGDVIRIESRITKIGRSAFDVSHRILKGEVLAVEGFETRVWVGRDPADSSKIRSRPLPEEVVSALSQGR